eukprot:2437040-Prymnesium_polylepis.1
MDRDATSAEVVVEEREPSTAVSSTGAIRYGRARLTGIRRIDGGRCLLIMQHRGDHAHHPAFSQLAPGRRRDGPCERSAGDGERDGRGGPTL